MRFEIQGRVMSTIFLTMIMGCSSTTIIQEHPALPEVPEYVKVPHPSSFELASLRSIFNSPLAPTDVEGAFATNCDAEYQKLSGLTNSLEERKKGASEMVTGDPERMHWCFYSKISKLQETLQSDTTWGERQKKVFETFSFITPVANAFLDLYHDSRYLRWATQYYSKISEWVFFRKVAPNADNTIAVMQGLNGTSMEPWISLDSKVSNKDSVFAKYGISMTPTVASGINPLEQNERSPASSPEKQNPESKGPVDLETEANQKDSMINY